MGKSFYFTTLINTLMENTHPDQRSTKPKQVKAMHHIVPQ